MPDELIKQRSPKTRIRHGTAGKVVCDLMQSKQFEMIDQEGAGQNDQPAYQRQAYQRGRHAGILDVPDNSRHRPPLPAQQGKRKGCEQHVGAALDRFRHELRPPFLELATRHNAVLDRKQRHQKHIYE